MTISLVSFSDLSKGGYSDFIAPHCSGQTWPEGFMQVCMKREGRVAYLGKLALCVEICFMHTATFPSLKRVLVWWETCACWHWNLALSCYYFCWVCIAMIMTIDSGEILQSSACESGLRPSDIRASPGFEEALDFIQRFVLFSYVLNFLTAC